MMEAGSAEELYLDKHRDTIETAFTRALSGVMSYMPEDPLYALAQQLECLSIERQALLQAEQIKACVPKKYAQEFVRLASSGSQELRETFARHQQGGVVDRDRFLAVLKDAAPQIDVAELQQVSANGRSFIDQLYDAFDSNGDGDIEVNEMLISWYSWFKPPKPVHALLIIDVQNDFISGTLSLSNCPAKHDGGEVVPVVNQLVEGCDWDCIAVSYDWHPHTHCSFHETVTAGKSPVPIHPTEHGNVADAPLFSNVILTAPDGDTPMSQTLWPRHCVEGSWGAELHPDVRLPKSAFCVLKGTDPGVDSYSAFYDNNRLKQTSLLAELRRKGVTHVHVCGLALDVCVAFTSLHAAEEGFVTSCIEDACRGVSLEGIASQKKLMLEAGVKIIRAADVPALLARGSSDDTVVAAKRVRGARQSVAKMPQTGHMPFKPHLQAQKQLTKSFSARG